jgi:ribosome-binding protein aMBF1 (putative translation factor)
MTDRHDNGEAVSLQEAFAASGLTQLELAIAVDSHPAHISRVLAGQHVPKKRAKRLYEAALKTKIRWPEEKAAA